jgi:ribonuclease HII
VRASAASAAKAAQAARSRAAAARATSGKKARGRARGARAGRSRTEPVSRTVGQVDRGRPAITVRGLEGVWFAGSGAARPGLPAGAPAGLAGVGLVGMEAGLRPIGYTPRRGAGAGLTGYERVLVRAGLGPVAGIDEAGRGACAGPLVVAAVAIDRLNADSTAGIADSKALTARAREAAYRKIVKSALAWHVVVIEPGEIDKLGLHVCNVAGMRRALAGLAASPGYVLTDGFEVPGLAVPALAMWKGDQVAACVAAASIVAKVTRDKIMTTLHAQYPEYGFARHKGYSTPSHMAALDACGPSPVHRRSFVNVSSRLNDAGRSAGVALPADDLDHPGGIVLADGSVLAMDEDGYGPIVELAEGRT